MQFNCNKLLIEEENKTLMGWGDGGGGGEAPPLINTMSYGGKYACALELKSTYTYFIHASKVARLINI